MGFWDGVGSANNPTEYGRYLSEGTYGLRIKRMFDHNGFNGHFLIVEHEVIESNNPEIPIGDDRSWCLALGKNQQLAFSNIKGYLAAVFHVDLRTPYAETFSKAAGGIMDRAISHANPLMGACVRVMCVETKTRAGGDFTRHQWYPYVMAGYEPPTVERFMAGPPPWGGAPPPPWGGAPPPVDPAKARALATPGWSLPDGRWYNGAAWVGP